MASTKSQLDAERAQNQERKMKVRAYLDNLSKENKTLQETHAAMEATMKDAVAAKNYMEQHRNQLETALFTTKDQVIFNQGYVCGFYFVLLLFFFF